MASRGSNLCLVNTHCCGSALWIRINLIEGEVQTSLLIESSEGGVDVHGWHSRFPIHGNESGISEHCDYANSFGSTRAVPT
jgi:hypothetical protein